MVRGRNHGVSSECIIAPEQENPHYEKGEIARNKNDEIRIRILSVSHVFEGRTAPSY